MDAGRPPNFNRAVCLSSRPLHRSAAPGTHCRQTRGAGGYPRDSSSCLINALTAEEHAGTIAYYARPGRIPSSINIPTIALMDPVTHAYLPAAQLRAKFAAVGTSNCGRVITYCGGAIAACNVAFVLTLLGITNVAVYDGSLLEWAGDPSLPMGTD